MVSGETFHNSARVYAGFELLLSSYTVWKCCLSYPTVPRFGGHIMDRVQILKPMLVAMRLLTVVSLIASVLLIVGVIMRVLPLVKAYKIYSIVRVPVMFIVGCFVAVSVGEWWFLVAIFYVFFVLPITALIIWILSGEIRFLKHEQNRMNHTMNPVPMQHVAYLA